MLLAYCGCQLSMTIAACGTEGFGVQPTGRVSFDKLKTVLFPISIGINSADRHFAPLALLAKDDQDDGN
jgi:hypothetical protein